jgi:NIMA (never in mitosis gene a)-related kinase
VEVLSKLDHPNIVRYHECFLESGILQIVMEFAEEGDMYGRIQQRAQAGNEPFSEDQVMFWFVQICLALKHVHSKRMLHRDLKTQVG